MKVSVVVSAYNEEKKIADCLDSVKDVASEIILINNSSTDRTVEVAKKYTDKILTRQNNTMLNINKNYGFTQAKGSWILNLDADERLTPELAREIAKLREDTTIEGYFIPRKNILFGKWMQHSIWWPDYQLRLFRNGKGRFPEKHVHEYIEVTGQTEKLVNPMTHLNYESVSQFIYKLEKIYTESEVENILGKGTKLQWYDALRMPFGDFLKTYFLQKGYKDGLHGLVLSLLQAFYMEVVFAKVWERQGFVEEDITIPQITQEFNELGKELSYWMITTQMENHSSKLKKIALKIKRKKYAKKTP